MSKLKSVFVVEDFGGPEVIERKIVKETMCYYFLDGMINFSNRPDKDDLGKTFFKSAEDAITAFVTDWEKCVQDARDMVKSRTEKLNKVKEWARRHCFECGGDGTRDKPYDGDCLTRHIINPPAAPHKTDNC